MMYEQNFAPIGMAAMREQVKALLAKHALYQTSNVKLPHFAVNLDAGEGQTTLTEYLSQVCDAASLRRFGGLDQFLEFRLDGTMAQLDSIFAEISACAVYTNRFEGIIALDVTALASCINESPIDRFLDHLKHVRESATCVFFVGATPTREMQILLDKLRASFAPVTMVHCAPYSSNELAQIAQQQFVQRRVQLTNDIACVNIMANIIEKNSVKTVAQLAPYVQNALLDANCASGVPMISPKLLSQTFAREGAQAHSPEKRLTFYA